ncbi:MAG: nicotinate (nicotinamide) nucleotide adenylyltransferase [Desulfobacteraceae bacterium]|nr:nicotinate (nicotinamide) nucleotide adenylyltransferase [Desulfobacteraceae bacterium]
MKIGLFGGTFNPFHNGHIGILEHVKKVYGFEKLFLIPSATPPHKPNFNLAPANDRFEMVKESLKGYENLHVSKKELIRKGPSFTIDTINEFKNEFGTQANFSLLMGSDAFLDITTWKKKDQIFEVIQIIIMLRGSWENYETIVSFIDENISKEYIFNKKHKTFTHRNKQSIKICKVPKIDISSTFIRQRVKNNESIKDLVPGTVEKMIRTKELYK